MDQETIIDACGLLCPLPVLRLRKRLLAMAPGAQVRLVADDPATAVDVPHFCAEAGHRLVASHIDGTQRVFVIERGLSDGVA